MAYVHLAIVEPQNNLPLEGLQSLDFTGEVVDMPEEIQGLPLYYRWYSSLYEPDLDENNKPYYFSIEQNAQTQADETFTPEKWTPGIGSHAITFAVSDRPGETADDLEAIKHGGVTGGAKKGDGQCLVHVFIAVPLPPKGDLLSLPRTALRLIAEAPAAWQRPIPETNPVEYEVNGDYHAYNRLRYRWEVIPDDASAQTFEYTLEPDEDLDFGRYSDFNDDIKPTIEPTDPEDPPVPNPLDVFVVHYKPPLADLDLDPLDDRNLISGGYTLTLHVEDKHQDGIGHHQDSIHVTIQDG